MAPRPTMRKKILGSHLRRLREAAGLTVDEAAEQMNLSRAAAYRQESGHSAVSLAEAEKYVRIYRVTDQMVIDRVVNLARASKTMGWWSTYRDEEADGSVQAELAEMEDMAYEMWTHEDHVVPALLQTSEYSEAIVNVAVSDHFHGVRARSLIDFRARRRAIMKRSVRGRFHFSFHETAMHTWAGERKILSDQAAHLVRQIELGHDIRMLPFSAGHTSAHAKTSVLVSADPSGEDMIAFVQGFPVGTILHDPEAVRVIRTVFTVLDGNCLSSLDTAAWLRDTFHLD